jgi:hypothetical protein
MAEARMNIDRPEVLSSMLEMGEDARGSWRNEELGEILRHQLAAPLNVALGSFSGEAAQILEKLGTRLSLPANLNELLQSAQPPIELLALTKRFGKVYSSDPESALPREIAVFIYYASIAVANLRCGERLTELRPEALKHGLQWCRDREWVDEPTRSLMNEALGNTGDPVAVESKKLEIPPVRD